MNNLTNNSFHDVAHYPQNLLQIHDCYAQVPVTYKKEWDDGFGARGWKLNATIGDPAIIASTRETGQRITTSVFIHDILDHFLSGFGVSGHRSEAMALRQLFKRTGSDPRSDYEQMVCEDIINGNVNGERLITFLPTEFHAMLPSDTLMTDEEIIVFLKHLLGENRLKDSLVEHFFVLGKAGENHAIESWKKLGLDPEKRTEIGLALQDILSRVDNVAEQSRVAMLEASITISNHKCILTIRDCSLLESIYSAQVA